MNNKVLDNLNGSIRNSNDPNKIDASRHRLSATNEIPRDDYPDEEWHEQDDDHDDQHGDWYQDETTGEWMLKENTMTNGIS